MKHADSLIERILFLEGMPNLQELGKLHIGENVQGNAHVRPETGNGCCTPVLREAIVYAESIGDFVSRELFEEILESEEEHIDWLETQLELINKVGLENYLQEQMHA